MIFFMMEGGPDCTWTNCWHSVRSIASEQTAVRLPSSAQQQPNRDQPCLERLLSLGVTLPGYQHPDTWECPNPYELKAMEVEEEEPQVEEQDGDEELAQAEEDGMLASEGV